MTLRAADLTLGEPLTNAKWLHTDGELVVVSGAANCESRVEGRRGGNGASSGILDALRERASVVSESERFSVFSLGDSVVVAHRLEPFEVDNDLAEIVADELVRSGRVEIANAFERCFAGVVLSSAESPDAAWRMFYENTLSKFEEAAPDGSSPTAVFGRIYERARSLIVGESVLDVGTCFGFFPMILARKSPCLSVTALDVSEPMVALAGRVGSGVSFVRADALDLPFEDGSFDTVASIHVLEHLSPPDGERALFEMQRVARRRVVVAVPLEKEPDFAFGHVRSFDRESLIRLAEGIGCRCVFEEYHGGWLVLEPSRP